MPTGKLYPNGLTSGMGGNPNPTGGKRGEVSGWSQSAVRRHTRWLYAIDTTDLDGHGWSITLTMREAPASHAEWHRLRARYLRNLRESGLVLRGHWVTEWTRRKVPHVHLAVYLRKDVPVGQAYNLLVQPWVRIASDYGTAQAAQHMAPIFGTLGWLEYLSKHAARGINHYQRSGKPPGWEKTGRLWGHFGDWPVVEPIQADLTREEFWRFRRLVRSWRLADARMSVAAGKSSPRRIRSARTMLACADPDLSEVRGVSEWIPEHVGMALLDAASQNARTHAP